MTYQLTDAAGAVLRAVRNQGPGRPVSLVLTVREGGRQASVTLPLQFLESVLGQVRAEAGSLPGQQEVPRSRQGPALSYGRVGERPRD